MNKFIIFETIAITDISADGNGMSTASAAADRLQRAHMEVQDSLVHRKCGITVKRSYPEELRKEPSYPDELRKEPMSEK